MPHRSPRRPGLGLSASQQSGFLRPEPLENRQMLAIDFDLLFDTNDRSKAGDASPRDLVAVEPFVYFAATNANTGTELWRSDGSSRGTQLVADIFPGNVSSNPRELTLFNGELYFAADDGANGVELWASNGTSSGTRQVWTGVPGPSGSNPLDLTPADGKLYFTAASGRNRRSIFEFDAASKATRRVFGSDDFDAAPRDLTLYNGNLYFSAMDPVQGRELWSVSLGGPAVGQIWNINNPADESKTPFNSNPAELTISGGKLFLSAELNGEGRELWVVDGPDKAPRQVVIRTGAPGSDPNNLFDYNGSLVFSANEGTNGNELWISGGAAANTRLLADIAAGSKNSNPANFAVLNGSLYFSASAPDETGTELWSSDGTGFGTAIVMDIVPGFASSLPQNLRVLNDRLFFTVDNGVVGRELWVSDGSVTGTNLVLDIRGTGALDSSSPSFLTAAGDKLFFVATENSATSSLGTKIVYTTDGTDTGTKRTRDIFGGTESAFTSEVAELNGQIFYVANDGKNGEELWVEDRDKKTAFMLSPEIGGVARAGGIREGALSSYPTDFEVLDGLLFFRACDNGGGFELWATDGTNAGTQRMVDLRPGTLGSTPKDLAVVGSRLFFQARDAQGDIELYVSDGSPVGTVRVADVLEGAVGSRPQFMTPLGDRVVFAANDGTTGTELWVSDGFSVQRLRDINTGTRGSDPRDFVQLDGKLYFSAESSLGRELWVTDGTANGTRLAADTFVGPTSSNPSYITPFNGEIYFASLNPRTRTRTLYKTDGTNVQEVTTAGGQSIGNPVELTAGTTALYFQAASGISGPELWKTNGDTKGAELVRDINAGPTGSVPSNLSFVDGKLFFSANDGKRGRELWMSDGTTAGTTLAFEFNPIGDSNPSKVSLIGSRLVVVADSLDYGQEVFVAAASSVNQAPTAIGLSSTSISETATVGAVVGLLTATDPNPGDTHTFTLVAGTGDSGNAKFSIVGNELRVNGPLDFETQSAYSIRVRATDAAGGTFDRVIAISVVDGPDGRLGDINGDGRVDISDFVIMRNNFGRTGVTAAEGDTDGDGDVDLVDFIALRREFGL